MCLGVPGQIVSIKQEDDILRTGVVDFSGVTKKINLSFVPEASPGHYVIVHAGFAICTISEKKASETLKSLEALLEP